MAGTRLKGGARRQAVKTRCSRAIQGKYRAWIVRAVAMRGALSARNTDRSSPTDKERARRVSRADRGGDLPGKALAVGQHRLTSDAFIAQGAGIRRYTLGRWQVLLSLSGPPSKKVVVSLGCILFRNVFTAVFLDEETT